MYKFTCLCIALSLPTGLYAAPAELPDELVLSGDNIINIEIEGRPLRLKVRPDAASAPTINPAIAQQLGFKPGMFSIIFAIGPTRITATPLSMKSTSLVSQKNGVYYGRHKKLRLSPTVRSALHLFPISESNLS